MTHIVHLCILFVCFFSANSNSVFRFVHLATARLGKVRKKRIPVCVIIYPAALQTRLSLVPHPLVSRILPVEVHRFSQTPPQLAHHGTPLDVGRVQVQFVREPDVDADHHKNDREGQKDQDQREESPRFFVVVDGQDDP
jgi:hypothetical protein